MIICDKCGAKNGNERLICCDCGRELINREIVEPEEQTVIPQKIEPVTTGSSTVGYETDIKKEARCQKCGHPFSAGDVFCRKCGATLEFEKVETGVTLFCSFCGTENPASKRYCQKCGKDLTKVISPRHKENKNFLYTLLAIFIIGVLLFFLYAGLGLLSHKPKRDRIKDPFDYRYDDIVALIDLSEINEKPLGMS